MSGNGGDEFYVGYVPDAPTKFRVLLRRLTIALLALSAAVALLLVKSQGPFDQSVFEYGQYGSYEGRLEVWPAPMLVSRGGRYLLVDPGKHGWPSSARGLEGRTVRLSGALIQRGDDRMLEVLPSSIQAISTAQSKLPVEEIELGSVNLVGEIVDSKCYLGVMNPGRGKVHRECAVRCISGGIPPAFLVRDEDGMGRVLLLTGSDGKPLGSEILDYVAEPIRIRGRLSRVGSTLVLRAEPRHFERLSTESLRHLE